MSFLVVTDDGELREPHRPVVLYMPYGFGVAMFGEAMKHFFTAARCVQSVTLLNMQLLAAGISQ